MRLLIIATAVVAAAGGYLLAQNRAPAAVPDEHAGHNMATNVVVLEGSS